MRIEKTNLYVTDDGREFLNLDEAIKHENKIIFDRLHNNVIEIIGEHLVMKINHPKELDVLLKDDYGEISCDDDISKGNLSYPFYICKRCYDDWYFHYMTLDNLIKQQEQILDQLKEIK